MEKKKIESCNHLENIEFKCKNCQIFICENCKKVNHIKHGIERYQTTLMSYSDEIEEILENLNKNLPNLYKNVEIEKIINEKLDSLFEQIIKILKKNNELIKIKLNLYMKDNFFEKEKKNLENEIFELTKTLSFLKNDEKNSNKSETLSYLEKIDLTQKYSLIDKDYSIMLKEINEFINNIQIDKDKVSMNFLLKNLEIINDDFLIKNWEWYSFDEFAFEITEKNNCVNIKKNDDFHSCLTSKNYFDKGKHKFKIKLIKLEFWIYIGISSSTSKLKNLSYESNNTFGWSQDSCAWNNGIKNIETDWNKDFQEGDKIELILDCEKCTLQMKIFDGKVYEHKISPNENWHIHFNMYSDSDELIFYYQD